MVLVTGATGFVGQALCKRLLAEGMRVRATVRGEHSLAQIPAGADPVCIQAIGPHTDWSEALMGVDTVVHLAARVHVMNENSGDSLKAYREVNVEGTKRLAQSSATAGVKRFIFLSSIKVNGEETSVVYTEEDIPAPRDPYGISKREAEDILKKIAHETVIELVIIRPPLVYGPGVKANFRTLLGVVERGYPLPLADIKNSRSLIYLGNLIDAITTCISHQQAAGQTFLVSDGEDVSTPELVQRIGRALSCPARLIRFPTILMRAGGKITGRTAFVDRLIGSLVVDSGKIRRQLGWTPPVTMIEGLKVTADWFKKCHR